LRKTGTPNPWNKGKRNEYTLTLSEEERQRRSAFASQRKGENHPQWNSELESVEDRVYRWMHKNRTTLLDAVGWQCDHCGETNEAKLRLHHVIPVKEDLSKAYEVSNLQTLCQSCHTTHHKTGSAGRKLRCHPVKVVSIVFLGYEETYDIEVDGAHHNFVANGVVVHNSFRYSGERINHLGGRIMALTGDDDMNFWRVAPKHLDELQDELESLFYVRPTGHYRDRFGASIHYGELERIDDLLDCLYAAYRYTAKTSQGMPAEMAAGGLPMDTRQAWVATFNARSLCSFFDRRTPADAQLEIRELCDLMWPHFCEWLPGVAKWYRENRWGKNKLAP
jgi:thymidylate synthase (FAD)